MSVVGVDLGGTKLVAAPLEGDVLGRQALRPTPARSEAILDALAEVVAEVRTPSTEAVGVGVPSTIEWTTGRVVSSVNIPLRDVPLRAALSSRIGLPVFVDNDGNCAALAEAEAVDGEQPIPNLVMFTVGTGVGGGLVLDGRPFRGATGAGAEMGHTLIGLDLEHEVPGAAPFPQPGSLETLAAGRALDRLAARLARDEPGSALGRRLAERGTVYGGDAVELAQGGDAAAARLVELLGERLGIGIANAINLFDPDVVAIGGGVSRAGPLLLEPARRVAWEHVKPGVGTRCDIRLARHGVEAGVRGAAQLAVHELAREAVA